jgi:hypothetical protein
LQKEVIPIDTHVFQIAHKLYSFKPSTAAVPVKKRASGEKIPMSPKLYEEVAENLGRRWGVYGGWTQAVRSFFDPVFHACWWSEEDEDFS